MIISQTLFSKEETSLFFRYFLTKMKTASIIIIGNEILSGRTQDTNSNYLAKMLAERGISLPVSYTHLTLPTILRV